MENSAANLTSSMGFMDIFSKEVNIGIITIPLWTILITIIIVLILLCKNGIFDNLLGGFNMSGGSNNIQESKQIKTTTKIYNFNTTWCGHSVNFQPIWDEFSKETNLIANLEALDVKCDNDDGDEICEEYNVKGFPSVILEKYDENGEPIRLFYNGERTLESLRDFRDSNIDN